MADLNLWVPVITGLAGIGGALGGQYVSHIYARQREKDAAARKHHDELVFITTELVFLLEEFAEGCALVAADNGVEDQQGICITTTNRPELELSQVTGDWRALPLTLMYRIRELPILLNEAGKRVDSAYDNDCPPDYSFTFTERQYQYTRLGLKALLTVRRLRKLAGLPPTRLDATPWSAQPVLWETWRRERKGRAEFRRTMQRRQALSCERLRQNYRDLMNLPSGGQE